MPYDPWTKTQCLFRMANKRGWHAIMLSDVNLGANGTKYVKVDGKEWVVVVRGKVAIAMDGPLTAEWRGGGAKVHVARTAKERVVMVRFPRVGSRKGLALVAAYAPVHAAPQRVRTEFWDQMTTVMRASNSDDIVVVGGTSMRMWLQTHIRTGRELLAATVVCEPAKEDGISCHGARAMACW